jgi:hypothetical protein
MAPQKSPPSSQAISPQSSAQPPTHVDLDSDGADGVDALPVSYKKNGVKKKERNVYHVCS